MKLFTAEQMRNADQAAVRAGVTSQLLMEAAGQAVAAVARRRWPELRHVLILCGRGNNGGDGYTAARHLHLAGVGVTVLELASSQGNLTSEDARAARAAYLAQELPLASLTIEQLQPRLAGSDLIIDAIFGSGLSRPIEGSLSSVIQLVNRHHRPVLSIDVPSGIFSDNVRIQGPHVEATHTLQLAGAKLASALYPARSAFGSWEVADIGIPPPILESSSNVDLVTRERASRQLPPRAPQAHKYSAGTVLVVAGSPRYLGAAELACRAAYRAGAGLVTLAAEARLPGSWPEIVFEYLSWEKNPWEVLDRIEPKRAQARVIGPGLDERANPFLPELIQRNGAPAILDAGALKADNKLRDAVRWHGHCILTPHIGEAARLLELPTTVILDDPLTAARTLAGSWKAITVLKGATTVIASPEGSVAVSTRGHPGMATGGVGDVLAGLLGSWSTGATNLFERTAAAVFLHGLAGEIAAERQGLGLLASDLIAALPAALATLA